MLRAAVWIVSGVLERRRRTEILYINYYSHQHRAFRVKIDVLTHRGGSSPGTNFLFTVLTSGSRIAYIHRVSKTPPARFIFFEYILP